MDIYRNGCWGLRRVFIPKISLLALIALLYTIVIMFFCSFYVAYRLGFKYDQTVTIAFTAGSNNFELVVAVAIFGILSDVAFTAVIGPLIEVPVMITIVNCALLFKRRYCD